jgi:transcriptional regulator with XRE-family HTH domain
MPARNEIATPGQVVRQRRRDLGLSTEQLAVSANVSAATIGRLERDEAIPKHAIVMRIANVLGVSAAEIYEAASA